MVIWLELETRVINKGGTKRGTERCRWVGEEVWVLLGMALMCIKVYITVVVEGTCVRDCSGLGVCMVGKLLSSW
jgi:hypothetical protein